MELYIVKTRRVAAQYRLIERFGQQAVSRGGAIAVMLRYTANFNPDINSDVVQHNICINKFELFCSTALHTETF